MPEIIWGFYVQILSPLISLYTIIVFVSVVLSWLVSFGVINVRNQVVATIYRIVYQLTEPALSPIRRILPSFGGLDFSPMVLLLGLWYLNDPVLRVVFRELARAFAG